MNHRTLVLILALVFAVFQSSAWAQAGLTDKAALQSSVLTEGLLDNKETVSEKILVESGKSPVTIFFNDGRVVKGFLMHAVSGDSDKVWLEIDGRHVEISLDLLSGIRRDPCVVDSFGEISWNDMKARIDNLLIMLQNDPNAHGVFIAKGPNMRRAKARLKIANDFLAWRHFDASRIIAVGPIQKPKAVFQLWYVPGGSDEPDPDSDGVNCG
jgi:hypothetical protein